MTTSALDELQKLAKKTGTVLVWTRDDGWQIKLGHKVLYRLGRQLKPTKVRFAKQYVPWIFTNGDSGSAAKENAR